MDQLIDPCLFASIIHVFLIAVPSVSKRLFAFSKSVILVRSTVYVKSPQVEISDITLKLSYSDLSLIVTSIPCSARYSVLDRIKSSSLEPFVARRIPLDDPVGLIVRPTL
jgi:hypothetical protein